MRKLLTLAAVSAALVASGTASAADVTLRLHHFMGARAPLHSQFLTKWEAEVEAASEGRIDVQLFSSMSLGGKPGDLFDQAADGAVEIILTLPGYTSGRFNQTEVFELPFMMEDAVATTAAFWDLVESDLQDGEFQDVQMLAAWVHGPGVIHSKQPITKLEDMAGMEVRGPTRVVTDMLGELGATPVGMPLPSIPENLSKGVINGTLLPWEVTPSIKLAELVSHHTELEGDRALYTAAFIIGMNIDVYDELDEDLRAIIDAHTGKEFSIRAAKVMLGADAFGRARASRNSFISLDEAEVARWIEASKPVYDRWIARAAENGFDGQAAIDKAKALIAANKK